MKEIKIYPRKKPIYFTTVLLILIILGSTYFVFFSGSSQVTTVHKYIQAILSVYLIYTIYQIWKKYVKQIPTLVISDFALEAAEKLKVTTFLWSDILHWAIGTEDGTTYLTIRTPSLNRKINISLLDKSPFEIEELIKLKKKP